MEIEEAKLKKYELAFLVNSQEDAGLVVKHLAKIAASTIFEGPVVETRLAYPILNKRSGHFGYVHFTANPDSINKLNEAMKLDKSIVRFLIITPPPAKPQRPRIEGSPLKAKPAPTDLSNKALEEKLASLQEK